MAYSSVSQTVERDPLEGRDNPEEGGEGIKSKQGFTPLLTPTQQRGEHNGRGTQKSSRNNDDLVALGNSRLEGIDWCTLWLQQTISGERGLEESGLDSNRWALRIGRTLPPHPEEYDGATTARDTPQIGLPPGSGRNETLIQEIDPAFPHWAVHPANHGNHPMTKTPHHPMGRGEEEPQRQKDRQ
ncbi:hypothetical protein TNCV_1618371 [Trichonephila clavipes]|nr:hypothetical protein TNCV_1618371 [Trichonephila clavipes]